MTHVTRRGWMPPATATVVGPVAMAATAATAVQRRRGLLGVVLPRRNGSSIVRGNGRAGIGIGRHTSFTFTCRSSMDNDEDMDDSDDEYDGPHSSMSEDEEYTYVLGGDVDGLFDGGDPSMRLYLDSADYEQWKRYVVLASTGWRCWTTRGGETEGRRDGEGTEREAPTPTRQRLTDARSLPVILMLFAVTRWSETGMFYGFTTNPTILKRDGVKCTLPSIRQMTRLAFELDVEELQLQAWGETVAEMYSNALDLAELDTRVVVKVPMTMDGIRAARRLVNDGVPVTFTAVYSVHQAVTAMSVGASYIAPYLGRMNDAGRDGFQACADMQAIVDMGQERDGETRLLVASIRGADELATLAVNGCNTFTIGVGVAEELVSDALTIQAARVFEEHANEGGGIGG